MQVKNPELFSLLETMAQHYQSNIANRFTRRALSSMVLDSGTWHLIEELTEKIDNYRYQGYHLDELYTQILALARFIYQARRQVAPNLRFLASAVHGREKASESDRVFRNMAVNNFSSNLKILADYLNDLYLKVVAMDKAASGAKQPVFSRIPELKELGRYLVE
ncbi:MAG TPA: hypothetical protein VLH39_07685 [Magnetospirillaceae bacterium]|nr:hypothetical protein [Magnetospirillaceae bacterium]